MLDFLTWMLPYAVLSLLLGGAAVLLCDLWGKRLRSRTCLLLLVLLCARIVIPTGFSPIALLEIPLREVPLPETDMTLPDGQISDIPNPPEESDVLVTDSPRLPIDTDAEEGGNASVVPPISSGQNATQDAEQSEPSAWEAIGHIVLILWIGGAIFCLSIFYLPGFLYRRRLRKSCGPVTDGTLLRIYEDVCCALDVRRAPVLYQSTAVQSPCLCGTLRPYIVLPYDGALSAQELEMLLRHELQHSRHGDLYIKHFINICLGVQWWNPSFYLLARRVSYYIEAACDESVLMGRDAEFRLQYGALLAKMAKKSTVDLRMQYASETGFARRAGHAVLRRVQNLMANTPRRRGGVTIATVAGLCVLSLFLYGFALPETVTDVSDDPTVTEETVLSEEPTAEAPSVSEELSASEEPSESVTAEPETEPTEEEVLVFSRVGSFNWYAVTGVRDRSVTEVEVPTTHQGYPVVRICVEAFADCRNLVRVVVGDGVKDIEEGAFSRCTSLKEVVLSKNLFSLGASAFRECTSLTHIEIPSGVMTLQSDTFYHCTALRSVVLSDGLEQIQTNAFVGNTALTQLTLPASVWMLETSAIKDCEQLRTLRYEGTQRQWSGVMRRTATVGDVTVGWCDGIGATYVVCSDDTSEDLY